MITDGNVKDLMNILDSRINQGVSSQLSNVVRIAAAVVTGTNSNGLVSIRLISDPLGGGGAFDVPNKSGENVDIGDNVWIGWFGDLTNSFIMLNNTKAPLFPGSSSANLLDNSSFLVAQAGYGGTHGSAAYAADRWRVSGVSSVTGQDGGGIWLSGAQGETVSLWQNFESGKGGAVTFFADGIMPIGEQASMSIYSLSSGEPVQLASISEGGERMTLTAVLPSNTICRITCSNLSHVGAIGAYPGVYTAQSLPLYYPKRYAEELEICRDYYIPVSANGRFAGNVGANTSTLQCYIPTGKAMRAKPSLTVSQNITIVGYVHTGAYNDSAASMSVMDADANGVRIQISGSKQIGSSTYASVIVAITTPFGLSADLEG